MYLIVEVGEVDEVSRAVMCAKATATGENMTSMETKTRRTNFKEDRRNGINGRLIGVSCI
jgi:hypothetical protein